MARVQFTDTGMTIRIDDALIKAQATPWQQDCAKGVLQELSERLPGLAVDWDEGAGEDWALFLIDNQVSAFLWMRGPLAMVSAGSENVIATLEAKHIAVVQVPDMDESCLCCEKSVVTQFAGRAVSDAIDYRGFSASDLWWVTV